MAEELKQEEKKAEGAKGFSTFLKVILGLVFLVLGIWTVIIFRGEIFTLIKGCVGPFLLLAGVITLAIAKD